jgi:hypothetical protein
MMAGAAECRLKGQTKKRRPGNRYMQSMNAINVIAPYKWMGMWAFDNAVILKFETYNFHRLVSKLPDDCDACSAAFL